MLSDIKDKVSPIPDFKDAQLKQLDILPHFKSNLINSDKNCLDPITEHSKYCFTCRVSLCPTCCSNLKAHSTHLLLPRKAYLFFNEDFFAPIERALTDVLAVAGKKSEVVNAINEGFNSLKERLDQIRDEKLKGIERAFEGIEATFKELRDNFDEAKRMIYRYYKVTEYFQQINKNNLDRENAAFLMNFEMINLYDNKNIEAFEAVNRIYMKVNEYKDGFIADTQRQLKEMDPYGNKEIAYQPLDNFYWDIKTRCKTYMTK